MESRNPLVGIKVLLHNLLLRHWTEEQCHPQHFNHQGTPTGTRRSALQPVMLLCHQAVSFPWIHLPASRHRLNIKDYQLVSLPLMEAPRRMNPMSMAETLGFLLRTKLGLAAFKAC